MCGGSGTRLWPASRETFPKQFIPVVNGKSLFELTLERVKSIKDILKPIVITNEKYKFLVRDALVNNKLKATVLLEPIGRNTAPAIYLALKLVNDDENLIIMPSDHFIGKNENFFQKVNKILSKKISSEWITLGITPDFPSTSYGYIKLEKNSKNRSIFEVSKFVEKPNLIKAKSYIKSKNYLWNSGIFIGNAKIMRNSIKKNAPLISKKCDIAFKKVIFSNKKDEYLFNLIDFKEIPVASIDVAVIEKSNYIECSPIECEWNDVGSWEQYFKCFPNKNNVKKIVQVQSKNNSIKSANKLITTIGVQDLIIVDNQDSILIAKKGLEEKMRDLIKSLQVKNIPELKDNIFEKRPWGKFENIFTSKTIKIKKITVNPLSKLSKQFHNFRSEHWFIIKGNAIVYKDGEINTLKKGDSVDIPKKSIHYIENKTKNNLIFIEIQMGEYFGEDDIIRIDDIYDRK